MSGKTADPAGGRFNDPMTVVEAEKSRRSPSDASRLRGNYDHDRATPSRVPFDAKTRRWDRGRHEKQVGRKYETQHKIRQTPRAKRPGAFIGR